MHANQEQTIMLDIWKHFVNVIYRFWIQVFIILDILLEHLCWSSSHDEVWWSGTDRPWGHRSLCRHPALYSESATPVSLWGLWPQLPGPAGSPALPYWSRRSACTDPHTTSPSSSRPPYLQLRPLPVLRLLLHALDCRVQQREERVVVSISAELFNAIKGCDMHQCIICSESLKKLNLFTVNWVHWATVPPATHTRTFCYTESPETEQVEKWASTSVSEQGFLSALAPVAHATGWHPQSPVATRKWARSARWSGQPVSVHLSSARQTRPPPPQSGKTYSGTSL